MSLKSRIIRHEIEATVVHRIAHDLEVSLYTASLIRRLFLLETCLKERLCVELSGSAHHTPTGDGAAQDVEDPPESAADDEGQEGDPPREPYTYVNEGVLLSVAAGLVSPVGGPFKPYRSATSIYRYVRLTPTGRLLAAQYIRLEMEAKARKLSLASAPFEEWVKQDYRAGRLSLKCPSAPQ